MSPRVRISHHGFGRAHRNPVVAALAGLAVLLLAGCSTGPKYARPTLPAPVPPAYKEAEGWKTAQPGDQTFRGKWWEIFGDAQLNALEEQVSISNQNLKAAEAHLREARALIRFNRAAEFPTISTAPGISSLRDSAHMPYSPSSVSATCCPILSWTANRLANRCTSRVSLEMPRIFSCAMYPTYASPKKGKA